MVDPMEIWQALRYLLHPEQHARSYTLAHILADMVNQRLTAAEVGQRLAAEPAQITILRALTGRQIALPGPDSGALAFNDTPRQLEVWLRDAAGRDTLHLTIPIDAASGWAFDPLTRMELERAYREELVDRYAVWGNHYAPLALRVDAPVRQIKAEPSGPLRGGADNDKLRPMIAEERPGGPRFLRHIAPTLSAALDSAPTLLLVLGQPGGGKSSALQHFAYQLATAGLQSNPLTKIPVVVPLNRIISGNDPLALIAQELREAVAEREPAMRNPRPLAGHRGLAPALNALVSEGRLILLWDGLDELPPDLIEPLARRIERFHAERAGSPPQLQLRGIITCRSEAFAAWRRAYRGKNMPLDPQHTTVATLDRLGEAARRGLILHQLGGQRGGELIAALEQPERRTLRQLTHTPLLLSMLCEIYRTSGALPESRGALIDSFVSQRGGGDHAALQRLASAMREQRKGASVAVDWAARTLSPDSAPVSPAQLQALVQETGWLELNPGGASPQVRFSHQIVQDYFAARALKPELEQATQQSRSGLLGWMGQRRLERYLHPGTHTGKEELVLMLAGMERDSAAHALLHSFLSQPLAAARLLVERHDRVDAALLEALYTRLRALIGDQGQPARDRAEASAWLGQLASAEQISVELRGSVRTELWRIIVDPSRTPGERLEAGRALGNLGDPRPGVATVEPDWCSVPAGPFWLGSHPDDPNALDWEKPARLVELPSFRIARYAVTNAQWRLFMQDGGPEHFGGWWRRRETLGQTVPQQSEASESADPSLSGPNQPVIGVSWYQAQAFCQWLAARLGYGIYLPSEAQWEKAARGVDGRPFPWGGAWETSRCNSYESPPDTTAPVGCYPDGISPYGALDMSGNTWEWTDTPWWDSHSRQDGRQRYQASEERPLVVKGGPWYEIMKAARCPSRFFRGPSACDDGLGFRVAADLEP